MTKIDATEQPVEQAVRHPAREARAEAEKGSGWYARAGVLGHLARAVVFMLVGIFITKAAIDYNAKEAIGLDGALQKLANQSYGPWLLGVTAAGLLAYGIFCLVDARYRDVATGGAQS